MVVLDSRSLEAITDLIFDTGIRFCSKIPVEIWECFIGSKFGLELITSFKFSLSKSFFIILPWGPEPAIFERSIFFSKAIFLASGEATTLELPELEIIGSAEATCS